MGKNALMRIKLIDELPMASSAELYQLNVEEHSVRASAAPARRWPLLGMRQTWKSQAAVGVWMKPCFRSIFIQRGALRAKLRASQSTVLSW